jgi:3-oxoacyl-[acyl-carrier-protein] synthase II
LGRRVVVTGIGLICGVGNTTGEVWQAVLAGKSGVARITQFDSSNFACQIAAEVKNFDPLNFIEKKKSRRWDASSTWPSPPRMKRSRCPP